MSQCGPVGWPFKAKASRPEVVTCGREPGPHGGWWSGSEPGRCGRLGRGSGLTQPSHVRPARTSCLCSKALLNKEGDFPGSPPPAAGLWSSRCALGHCSQTTCSSVLTEGPGTPYGCAVFYRKVRAGSGGLVPSQKADGAPFWNVLSAFRCPVMSLASLNACTQRGLLLSCKGVRDPGLGAGRLHPVGDRERLRCLSSVLSTPVCEFQEARCAFQLLKQQVCDVSPFVSKSCGSGARRRPLRASSLCTFGWHP